MPDSLESSLDADVAFVRARNQVTENKNKAENKAKHKANYETGYTQHG